VSIAQVLPLPAETVAQEVSAATRTGASRRAGVPSPSCPFSLLPQHHRVRSVRMAQAWLVPVDAVAHVASRPTCTGPGRCSWVPSPTCPAQLLPQHHMVWSVRIAHAEFDPSDSDAHVLPPPSRIRSGLGGEAVVGLTNPIVVSVQHHKAPVTSIPHGGDHPADTARHFSGVILTAPDDEEPTPPAVSPEPLPAGRGADVEQPPAPSTTKHSATMRAISNPAGESPRFGAVPSDAFVIDSVSVIAVPAPRSGTDGDAEQVTARRHPARRGHPHGASVPRSSVTGQGARCTRYREGADHVRGEGGRSVESKGP
jgi:hypothetical protein